MPTVVRAEDVGGPLNGRSPLSPVARSRAPLPRSMEYRPWPKLFSWARDVSILRTVGATTAIPKRASSRVLVVPPADRGSLGDQAIIEAVMSRGDERRIVLASLHTPTGSRTGSAPSFDLGPWFSQRAFPVKCLVKAIRNFDRVVILGADVMNGFYSDHRSAMRWALGTAFAGAGRGADIIGCSFDETEADLTLRAIRLLDPNVRVVARDPISASRLTGALDRAVDSAADAAFALKPGTAPSRVVQWIGRAGLPPVVIGINGSLEEEATQSAAEAVASRLLAGRPARYIFIPHDLRSGSGDVDWAIHISSAVEAKAPGRAIKFEAADPSEVKAVVGLAVGCVTGRMHLGIAALSQGIPTRCASYNGKVEGLAHLMESTKVAVDVEGRERFSSRLTPLVDEVLMEDLPAREALSAAAKRARVAAEEMIDSAVR